MNNKVVLAYSGGLDTSIILKYLIKEKNLSVIAYLADLGQEADFVAAKEKALALGAEAVEIVDLKQDFLNDYIEPAIRANLKYEGRYLLGTALARPITAEAQVAVAKKYGATVLAHGATGKGNDQIRFEFIYRTLMPEAEIFAPWKDPEFLEKFKGRDELLEYAAENNIPVKQTKDQPWSTDDNMLHISYEAGMLENPLAIPRKDMFEWTTAAEDAPEEGCLIELEFKSGNACKLSIIESFQVDEVGVPFNLNYTSQLTDNLEIFQKLNQLGAVHGIGRLDLVESRYVGMKSRGVYETPAGTILMEAHQDLEAICLDREVIKRNLHTSIEYAERVYSGYWFSPELQLMKQDIDNSQKNVTGFVRLKLYKGNVTICGRYAENSLYSEEIASMHEEGGYDQTMARGFIDINAVRLQSYYRQQNK